MKYDKSFLRNKSLLKRRKKHLNAKKFDFNLIFNLIKKYYGKKKITIAGYYPANYEVNILKFLEKASKKNSKLYCQLLNLQEKCLLNHGFLKKRFM